MSKLSGISSYSKSVACSSFGLFKHSAKTAKAISTADFIMQVQPAWNWYLLYTALRCSYLTYQYKDAAHDLKQQDVWQNAQVYSSTKVSGLIVSQVALSVLGLTTPASMSLILGWGVFLFTLSAFAHSKAHDRSKILDEHIEMQPLRI